MDGEVIVERRRRWTPEQKAALIAEVEAEGGPTINAPEYARRKAGTNLPLVAAYATRKGDRLNVFVLSRRLDKFPVAGDEGFTPVELALPISSAEKITLHRFVGDPRSHNLDSEEVKIETVPVEGNFKKASDAQFLIFPVNDTTGADKRGLPPASTLLYVFEGVKK